MTDLRSAADEYEPPAGAPRCVFFRVSLGNACVREQELSRAAASPGRAEDNQTIAISESEAAAAPTKELIPLCWGHQNASYWLKHTEVDSQAFTYTSKEPHIAAAFCAAELQVSRDIKLSDLELHIFSLAS